MVSRTDVTVIKSLSMVRIDGFEPSREDKMMDIDPPGSANHFVGLYGMAAETEPPGILWTDYETPGDGWDFDLLIATDEVESLSAAAKEAGYEVVWVREVSEPTYFGDGGGVCAILKHPDGWVILD